MNLNLTFLDETTELRADGHRAEPLLSPSPP
jgi:hypothetical protein